MKLNKKKILFDASCIILWIILSFVLVTNDKEMSEVYGKAMTFAFWGSASAMMFITLWLSVRADS